MLNKSGEKHFLLISCVILFVSYGERTQRFCMQTYYCISFSVFHVKSFSTKFLPVCAATIVNKVHALQIPESNCSLISRCKDPFLLNSAQINHLFSEILSAEEKQNLKIKFSNCLKLHIQQVQYNKHPLSLFPTKKSIKYDLSSAGIFRQTFPH